MQLQYSYTELYIYIYIYIYSCANIVDSRGPSTMLLFIIISICIVPIDNNNSPLGAALGAPSTPLDNQLPLAKTNKTRDETMNIIMRTYCYLFESSFEASGRFVIDRDTIYIATDHELFIIATARAACRM